MDVGEVVRGDGMKALDLFCKAGGASMGLHRAGFEVTGIDIEPQPHYPFAFHLGDALDANLDGYDFVWASPPCQAHSTMTKRWGKDRPDVHPRLIEPIRAKLKAWGGVYVIENVVGAPLENPFMLCGSMFGLRVRRHRLFEASFPVLAPTCDHAQQGPVVPVYGHAGGSSKRDGLRFPGTDAWRAAMGIDWMTGNELAEAIPPAYAEWIGRRAIKCLQEAMR